mgnify:CR=1 FL=1
MIVKAVVPVDKRKMQSLPGGRLAFVLYKSEAARFHIEEGNDLPAKTYEMIEEEILLKEPGRHYIFFSHRPYTGGDDKEIKR